MKLISILSLLILSTYSFAADKSNGCGLGWSLAKKNSFLSTSIRTTTNVIAPPTFGMTFGTSNCARHSIVKADKMNLHYTEINLDQLVSDMANGEGEYLHEYSRMMGCQPAAFKNSVQKNFSEIYTDIEMSAGEFLNNVKTHSVCI